MSAQGGPRLPAGICAGKVSSDGLKVTAGSVIQRDDLVQYTATADATSSGGVLRVPITCSSAGAGR
ncbi:baseplate J/gp47 family protein [Escherichia coli]|uniref:baseplate J/gp47 family protein n=1 Tax=Escherichia coli TaxID=562 RepID=UPI002020F269|nr:baseplate J/gp47 family protein [Escherichia coli]